MKIYIFHTPSHEIFLNDWFLPSIKDNFDIHNKKYDQICKSGNLNEKGWIETMHYKIDTIIRGIEENLKEKDNIIIHSDIDIQFFGKVESSIRRHMKDNDILFQKGGRTICLGFCVIRATEKTLNYFKNVKNLMKKKNMHDEKCAKELLRIPLNFIDNKSIANKKFTKNKHNIKWKYLPIYEFMGGQLIVIDTMRGKFRKPPKSIIMHHATCNVGQVKKLKQMTYVRDYVKTHYL